MHTDAGDGHRIPQRRLPAGRHAPRHAPRHAFAPHLTADARATDREHGHPNGGERLQITNLGMATTANRLDSPETSPPRVNPNAASPRGQFTLSYQLLPFSGRTTVRSLPQIGSAAVFGTRSKREAAPPAEWSRKRRPSVKTLI